jgi:hypothetical protein
MGLDSKVVLDACNAWRGSIKAESDRTKVTSEVKLGGRVLKDGEDKRTLAVKDSIKETAKVGYRPEGALVSLSDALRVLSERHDASVKLIEFPPEITSWLDRDTFKVVVVADEVPVASAPA